MPDPPLEEDEVELVLVVVLELGGEISDVLVVVLVLVVVDDVVVLVVVVVLVEVEVEVLVVVLVEVEVEVEVLVVVIVDEVVLTAAVYVNDTSPMADVPSPPQVALTWNVPLIQAEFAPG